MRNIPRLIIKEYPEKNREDKINENFSCRTVDIQGLKNPLLNFLKVKLVRLHTKRTQSSWLQVRRKFFKTKTRPISTFYKSGKGVSRGR